MATGFHLSTVGMSVRNLLAIQGKAQVPLITKKLQQLWLPSVEEAEIKAALKELVARKLVRALSAGFFEALTAKVFQQRGRPKYTDKDRDAAAWEGWH
jgi:hypothetical protein